MDDTERIAEFTTYVQNGGKVEAGDWMPDEYRVQVLRFVEMHANSELMGVLPEREWINRAPNLKRKLALTAKVQDEVGHAELLYRVAEDLGKSREAMLADLLAGKTKFHNVFHYPTYSWGDVAVIAWLVDAAAIQSQKALLDRSTKLIWPWIHHWKRMWSASSSSLAASSSSVRADQSARFNSSFLARTAGFHSSSQVRPMLGTFSASLSW